MKIKWIYGVLVVVVILLGIGYFSKIAVQPFPKQYLKDRDTFGQVNKLFSDAMDLTKPPDNSGKPFTMSNSQQTLLINKLQEGVNLSKQISDGFFDYLNPEMKHYFRNKYVKGNELFLEGLQGDTSNTNSLGVQKQLDGSKLIGEWVDWWNANRVVIIDKAFN